MKRAQKILITGATGNIGGAIARALAADGVRIALACCSNLHAARELGNDIIEMGSEAHILSEDISNARGAKKLIFDAVKILGEIDLIVHCASTFRRTPFGGIDDESFDEAISTNLGATLFLVQAAMDVISEGGSIVLFSDRAAAHPYGDYLPYSMAKAGIEALVRGLAPRIAPAVRINAIAPYLVTKPDDMSWPEWNALIAKIPSGRSSTPEEIADMVRELAISETMTGEIIRVDGGK